MIRLSFAKFIVRNTKRHNEQEVKGYMQTVPC